jgi:hypothetical protein
MRTYKVRNEIETKRNETKRNQRKRNETKRNQRKRNETKRNETKSTTFELLKVCRQANPAWIELRVMYVRSTVTDRHANGL